MTANSLTVGTKDDSFILTLPIENSFSNYPWVDELFGHKPHLYRRHMSTCTACAPNAAIISDNVEQLDFSSPACQLIFTRHLLVGKLRNKVASLHADWSQSQAVPDASQLSMSVENPLSGYQIVPTVASRLLPGYGLLMEQGTGKTPIVISRICTDALEKRQGGDTRPYTVLIVVPKNIRRNWENEFSKFASVKGRVTVMRGGVVKRVRELAEAMSCEQDDLFTVVIVSYGMLCQAWDQVLSCVKWDFAVADEMHLIKWHETDRTQYAWKVRDNAAKRMGLTGTAIVNSILDLYSQLEFLDKGLSGHGTFSSFKRAHGEFIKNGVHDVMTATRGVPIIKKILAETCFITTKAQVLKDLPPKQYLIREVEMSSKQWHDYDRLATQLYLEITEDLERAEAEGKREMVVNNAFVKLMKLAQITSGFLIVPEVKDEFGEVELPKSIIEYSPNPKIAEMIELCKELPPNEKMLIWCCYNYSIDKLSIAMNQHGFEHVIYRGATNEVDRKDAESRINRDPKCRFLIGNPAAGGVGLNLLGYVPGENDDQGFNVTQNWYYDQDHKPVSRWQSEDRAYRRGTRVPVMVGDLVVAGTIDEDIRVRVTKKKMHALDVQDLREILASIVRKR